MLVIAKGIGRRGMKRIRMGRVFSFSEFFKPIYAQRRKQINFFNTNLTV
jgi:hypothetical protein